MTSAPTDMRGDALGMRAAVIVFLTFAVAYFFSALVRAITATLSPTLSRELDLNAGDLGLLAGGYFLGFATAARLHGRFDKKIAIIVTCVLLSTIPAIAPVLRILGVFPEPGQPMLLPLIILFTGLGSCVASIMSISSIKIL